MPQEKLAKLGWLNRGTGNFGSCSPGLDIELTIPFKVIVHKWKAVQAAHLKIES